MRRCMIAILFCVLVGCGDEYVINLIGYWSDGNINADPLFVNSAYGDSRLSDSSPCISAGVMTNSVLALDIEGHPRSGPPGSSPDIGTYESSLGAPARVRGDVNGDGRIRSDDAILTLRIAAGLLEPTEDQMWAADINEDGKVKANDAIVILRKAAGLAGEITYPIVHTGLLEYYDDQKEVPMIQEGEPFFGQDANYIHNLPSYTDNIDGTISDNVTGLMWEKDMGQKITLEEAIEKAESSELGGYSDWRVPTIKELYSLSDFSGRSQGERAGDTLFIDTNYFNQPIGDVSLGEREIDAQTWSSTVYTGKTMKNDTAIFGFNFIDGRIKGYPKYDPATKEPKKMYFRLVRGNAEYGINRFVDNNDGTILDLATGLMWQQEDSKKGMNWKDALDYAENLSLDGYNDWRLPSAKELQSIVDYSRSPQATGSAAIDPLFFASEIEDTRGGVNYPFYWTATTFLEGPNPGDQAVYVSFGEALGKMSGEILDVHGAGAQRSDPKNGWEADYPKYHGPQGDIQRVYNYVRCVRTIK